MSPIPIQAWDASEHESGTSRVIHLDLAKDLSTHFPSVVMHKLEYMDLVSAYLAITCIGMQ